MKDSLSIVLMAPEDVEAVVSLESECGLSSRGADAYQAAIDNPHEILLVARTADSGPLLGVFSARIVIDEMEIDNIAVSAGARKRGIAFRLLREGLNFASKRGVVSAFLEVRASNMPALLLYRKAGFVQAGIRKSYYRDPHEDALILVRKLA